ncbi:TonB-dependent receptor (plasmid) [Hymenobacter tibetensis]|uniref:TonB-dependent receptor n=1 Tax=Hymenobacter tibetensis TaxID=497967 RepID=A0ABY4D4N2_9BACT|nr:TonB-dependent receptor [Hymenobacter tibetensis]UOG77323.1 TonB-dependent receptor [Hymenobacter tibetensis]
MKRFSTPCAFGKWTRSASTTACALCLPLLLPAAAGQVFASVREQVAQPAAVPLKQLLVQWEKQYGSSISYESNLIRGKLVVPQSGEGSLEDKLRGVLPQAGLQFEKLSAKAYVLLSAPGPVAGSASAAVADITVAGRVTQANGQALPGVTVVVKGTSQGTSTDGNGSFSLTVPSGSVLILSSIGFVAQEVAVTGPTLSVVLAENSKALDEVVVVGYGVQRKSDVTGAVASADIEAFREAPNTNIAQSLQGTVPGLNIGQVNSAGANPSIQIRGANTINGNADVLIVLDGIIYNGSLASINPDDVASIDVLKDASSTAVYGAQAANGVLLITTRKGKAGKTRIAYTGSYATQTPSKNLRPQNREEYLQRIRDLNYTQAYLAPDYTTPNPAFDITKFVDPLFLDASGNVNANDYDWWGNTTSPGYIQDHQLSVSGGGDKTTYLVSGGYTKQEGYIVNDQFNRKSIRINLETQATNWWKVGAQTFGSFNDYSGSEPTLNAIVRHPSLLTPYDEAGNLIPFPTQTILANPFQTFDVQDYDKRVTLFGNFYSEISAPFLKGLTYRLNFGNNYRTTNQYNSNKWGGGETGSASKNLDTYYDYTLDNILTYNKVFGKHEVTGTLLYSAIERQYSRTNASATGFSNITLGYNSLEQGNIQRTSSDAWDERLIGQMARLNYKFNNRYLLTATMRRDGFTGFATNKKYGLFPSAALGWIITDEPFFQYSAVNFLKLRAGYGSNGNLTSRYSSLSTVGPGVAYVFGDASTGSVFGQQVNSLANPNLKWESTRGINAGLDFVLLKNRLSGSLDYYNNKTNNLLFDVALTSITGFSTIRTNVGNVANQGMELSLTSVNVQTPAVKWSTTFNISGNRNKIIKLTGVDADGDGREDDLVASNLFIGKSINTIYDLKSDGLYQLGEEVPTGYYPGSARIVDANGDGKLERATDRVFLGREEPDYRTSMLNSVEYKGFTFRIFFNAVLGGENSYLGANNPNLGNALNDNSRRLNYFSGLDFWSPSNPNATYARSPLAPALAPSVYQNRSFVRLQDISLNYRFGGSVIKALHAENLGVFISAKNLATWTKWKGWDPETNQGYTDSGRPVLQGYSVGLNVTF